MSTPVSILILDDNPDDIDLLLNEIRQAGFDPTWQCVDSEEEYLALLESSPDIVLSDFAMPQLEARRALALLKERSLDIPLIVVSGTSDAEMAVECMRLGAADYLLKDNLTRLEQAMLQALEAKRIDEEEHLTEIEREKNEKKYRLLAENTLDVIWQMDLNLEFTYVNPAILQMTGYSQEEWIGSNLADHCEEKYLLQMTQLIAEEISKGQAHHKIVFETMMLDKQGSPFPVEVHGKIIFDEAGKPVNFQGTTRDITERKQIEQAQRESEQFIRSTLDGLSAHIAIVDQTGKILAVNQAWRDFADANLSSESNVCEGANYLDVCDTAVGSFSDGAAEFAAAIRAVLTGEEHTLLMEYPCHSPTEKRWFIGRVNRFPGGGPPRAIVAHENITERKRVEEALRQSEERYRLLAETTRDVIVLHDMKGLIRYVNRAGRDLGGLKLGEPITASIPDEFIDKVTDRQQARAEGDRSTYLYEIAFVNPEGQSIPVEINSSALEFDGEPQILIVARDITERKQAVEALRESEERFRAISSNTPDHILMQDSQLRYLFVVNPQLGLTEQNMVGKTDHDFLSKEDADKLTQVKTKVLETGESVHLELSLDSLEGKLEHFDGAYVPKFDTQGKVDGLIGYFRNITKHKEAEQALRESEERYRSTLDNMLEGCQIIDQDWRYIYINDTVAKQGRQTKEQLLGHTMMEVYPGIEKTPLFSVLRRCMDEHVPERMVNKFVYPDGSSGWFELSIQPVPEGLFILSNEITKRKQAEEALVHERDLLHTLMDNIPDSIYFKDTEGRFTRINQAESKLLNCDNPENALGKTDFDFFTHRFAQETFDDEQQIIKTGKPQIGKIEQIRWNDGQSRWASATKVPIRDNQGQVTGIVGITRDITDLKQAQEAEREQRTLAEALADVTAKLNSTLDLEEVLEYILANVGRVAQHDSASVMLVESGVAHVVRCQGRAETEDETKYSLVIAETPTLSQMAESREPLAIPETQNSSLWIPAISWIHSYAGAPIRLDDKVIGFINLDGAKPNMFTDDHARRLQAFADQAAVAIKNAQLFGQTEQRAAYLAALNDASNRVARWGLDLDGVLQAIVTLLVERVGVALARIWLTDDDGEYLILRASAGLHSRLDGDHAHLRVADNPGHIGQIAREREPVLLNQIQGLTSFDQEWAQTHGLVSFAGYPLRKNNHLVAVLAIFSTESLDHALLDMLGSFANQAAIAIENARLYHELEIHSGILEQAVEERTAELQQTKERVETILNYNPDPILLLKPDGAIETTNPAFKRVFGFQVDDRHKWLPTNLVIPAHADKMQAALQSAIDKHHVMRLELIARHQGGTTFDAEIALAPIQVDDALLGVVCSVRDISALKEVERMKDAFVSNVSHELRTPITSLKLSHKLMEKNPAGRERYMGRLDREINRLDNLIEDLLRLSRLDQGRVDLDIQLVDLNTLAAQYVNDRTPLAESQELSILFKKGSDLPPVQADEGLIGQVMSILLTNAFNYTPAGGTVTISTHLEELDSRRWAGFSVSDTGPGIISDDQSHVFERFYRGQAGLDSGAPGTGLGLAIAQEIVERHHGRIEIQSEGIPGQGSRFTVWLPIDAP